MYKYFSGTTDYTNIAIVNEEYPSLKNENDVLVRIKAVGLNFAELMQRTGFYKTQVKPPYTPGFEGSGVIEKLGSGVINLKAGDRVLVFNSHSVWKEVICLPSQNMIKIPDEMPFEDAAGLLVNYMTAYHSLFEFGHVKPGSKVLIHMAG